MKRFKRIFQRLHVFTDDYTSVVAYDIEDAAAVYIEWSGCSKEDIEDTSFVQVPDRENVTISSYPEDFESFKRTRPLLSKIHTDKEIPYITAPAWAWALQNKRGFLCSYEF